MEMSLLMSAKFKPTWKILIAATGQNIQEVGKSLNCGMSSGDTEN